MTAIRTATVTDIPAVHALVESGYRGASATRGWTHEAHLLGGQRTSAAEVGAIIDDPAQTLFVAEEGGRIIGCVVVAEIGSGGARAGYLGMLTVDPTLQARGLGRELIAFAEAHARSFGAQVMEMTVIKSRRELIDWYIRRGYADTGREEPFPMDDERFGKPKTRDLVFVVLAKDL